MLLRSTAPVFDMSTAPHIARIAHISRSNWGFSVLSLGDVPKNDQSGS